MKGVRKRLSTCSRRRRNHYIKYGIYVHKQHKCSWYPYYTSFQTSKINSWAPYLVDLHYKANSSCGCEFSLFSQVNQRTVAQLRTELDARKAEHAKLVEELSEQWESKLREAKEDYQRLVVSGLNIREWFLGQWKIA